MWTPPVIASDALTRPASAAAPRRRSDSSDESDSGSVRTTSSSSTSMSTRWKRVKSTSPSAPAASSCLAKWAKAVRSGASLTATGMRSAALHLAHDLDGLPLDLGRARRHVAGGVIEVQLEAVRAGLLRAAARRRSSRRA